MSEAFPSVDHVADMLRTYAATKPKELTRAEWIQDQRQIGLPVTDSVLKIAQVKSGIGNEVFATESERIKTLSGVIAAQAEYINHLEAMQMDNIKVRLNPVPNGTNANPQLPAS